MCSTSLEHLPAIPWTLLCSTLSPWSCHPSLQCICFHLASLLLPWFSLSPIQLHFNSPWLQCCIVLSCTPTSPVFRQLVCFLRHPACTKVPKVCVYSLVVHKCYLCRKLGPKALYCTFMYALGLQGSLLHLHVGIGVPRLFTALSCRQWCPDALYATVASNG